MNVPTHSAHSVLTLVAMAGTLGAAGAPSFGQEVVHLPGIVRDFLPSHPDFGVRPDLGMGHYAGNLDFVLGEDGRPAFTGNGFKVREQWRDRNDRPIPPHLAMRRTAVHLATTPAISGGAIVDTWNSSLGPYGGGNVGPKPPLLIGALDPAPEAPTDLGPSVGDVSYSGGGTTTLASSLHCDNLAITGDRTLRISSDVVILCEGGLWMADRATISIDSGASLDVYVMGPVAIHDSIVNGSSENYRSFTLYVLGTDTIRIADGAQIYANIVSPDAKLAMPDRSDFYGALTVGTAALADAAGVHIDVGGSVCGEPIIDTPGLASGASRGGITSADSFGQWYHDVPHVNLSGYHILELERNAGGVFEYLDDSFFPVDDQLLGNDGDHNRYFTFAFEVEFVYTACSGYFLQFEGSDDAWAFVDDQLVMDLGGIAQGTGQHVDIDRFDLEDGRTYRLRFFYAHRGSLYPVFRLRTNLPLEVNPLLAAVSGGFD
jgi:fibro-slime domain-containing protein